MNQAILFNSNLAMKAKESAIVRVDKTANRCWVDAAVTCVGALARLYPRFTTDSVWEMLESCGERTHEPRAMGAVMKKAVKAGVVEPTGEYRPSDRVACHGRPVAVWHSKMFGWGD